MSDEMVTVALTPLQVVALVQFECAQKAGSAGKEPRSVLRKREKVLATTRAFEQVMDQHPGINREDAIRLALSGLKLILYFVFPYLSLAVSIAGWLWDFTHLKSVRDDFVSTHADGQFG